MPLKLNDLIKKAKIKGLEATNHQPSEAFRPWQLESTLFTPNKKTETNRQQIDNKLETDQQQTDNKRGTNQQQIKKEERETDNKVITQPATYSTTKQQQSDNKATTKTSFSSLVGLQRELTIFIYNECKIARSKSTENLTLDYISKTVRASTGCIKTTLQRLEKKGVLERVEHKNGRGGWSKYLMPDQHFQKILQDETDNKLATNRQYTGNKLAIQPITQPATSQFSSSSNINKTTTTENAQNPNTSQTQLQMDWQNIDLEPLFDIGITKSHLSQIASQNKLSAEIVQDSINAFAFDLQENDKAKKIKGDPINFFIGILRRGTPYLPPNNYESPQDKAMRLYRENMRAIEQRRVEAEKETISLAFNDWFAKLTSNQKTEFLPEMLRRNASGDKLEKSKILESTAKKHFEKEVWPDLRENITSNKNEKVQ
jgi:hypothetical protein